MTNAAIKVPLKVVVCTGGRDYEGAVARMKIERAIADERPDLVIVGDCPSGVDRIVLGVCRAMKYDYLMAFAPWDIAGNAAGPMRNQAMVDYAMPYKALGAEVVGLSFPGNKGTKDCTNRMRKAGFTVRKIAE